MLAFHLSYKRLIFLLSRRKFYKVYKQFYPYGKPLNFSNLIFNTFDHDHDNSLDFHEFVKAISIVLHGNLEEKLKCAFKIYDSNGDGVIDKREMKIVIDSIYELIGEDMRQLKKARLSERKVDEIFNKLDTNKDNFISMSEFINGYLNDQYLMRLLLTSKNDVIKIIPDCNTETSLSNFEMLSLIGTNNESEISEYSAQSSSSLPPYEYY